MLQPQCFSLQIRCPVPGQVENDDPIHEQRVSGRPRLIVILIDTKESEFRRERPSGLLLCRCKRHSFNEVINAICIGLEDSTHKRVNTVVPRLLARPIQTSIAHELIDGDGLGSEKL